MAGVPRSVELLNAREQLLSSDIMRAQFLASRDAQNLEASRARAFDSNAAIPSGPGNLLQFNGTPISGVDDAPTLTGASGFSVTVGAGSGFLYNTGFGGLTSDDSPYLVARWATGQVTHSNPDPSNPRIDVIVATPATVNTDQQSRTVLVDPTTRSVTAQSVYKTSNPSATLSIIAGTPAGSPIPPAVPASALALFYVYVPAGAGSAASFAQCRATWRRVDYPLAAMSAVVCGMGLRWDLSADPTAASSKLYVQGFHRIVIDGELMEFAGTLDSLTAGVVVDTANNPFTGAAPTTWNKIYYVYGVGGRHNPMPSFNNGSGILSPITLVESLTPPNINTGKPTANMTVNGQTVTAAGAVYVGLGMVAKNTTFRAACIMTDEYTYFGGAFLTGHTLTLTKTNNNIEALPAPPSGHIIGFTTEAQIDLLHEANGGTPNFATLVPDTTSGGASGQMGLMTAYGTTTVVGTTSGRVPWPGPGEGALWAGALSGDIINVIVRGYRHRVNMVGPTAAQRTAP